MICKVTVVLTDEKCFPQSSSFNDDDDDV